MENITTTTQASIQSLMQDKGDTYFFIIVLHEYAAHNQTVNQQFI
jgi:hypothetical protein